MACMGTYRRMEEPHKKQFVAHCTGVTTTLIGKEVTLIVSPSIPPLSYTYILSPESPRSSFFPRPQQ